MKLNYSNIMVYDTDKNNDFRPILNSKLLNLSQHNDVF